MHWGRFRFRLRDGPGIRTLEGARRAGMRSVGVASDHHPELEADAVVSSLADLPPDAIRTLLES